MPSFSLFSLHVSLHLNNQITLDEHNEYLILYLQILNRVRATPGNEVCADCGVSGKIKISILVCLYGNNIVRLCVTSLFKYAISSFLLF